ncbi:unnamed protein product [Symbiodinium sp. CCMP2456]|nr:unnamed protein product [Symbiodinium sp. CCMP2456]
MQDGTHLSKIFSGGVGGAALLVAGLQPRSVVGEDGELMTLLTRIFELGILMIALGTWLGFQLDSRWRVGAMGASLGSAALEGADGPSASTRTSSVSSSLSRVVLEGVRRAVSESSGLGAAHTCARTGRRNTVRGEGSPSHLMYPASLTSDGESLQWAGGGRKTSGQIFSKYSLSEGCKVAPEEAVSEEARLCCPARACWRWQRFRRPMSAKQDPRSQPTLDEVLQGSEPIRQSMQPINAAHKLEAVQGGCGMQ